ncbi:MAG: flagellar filament capping protein FliD [Oscillospiraceae bacterium]|jgi:flagellar capping protein FliD|nr:flagellar filament capping protein FliD [Oscillospiraceae bacterium]
MASTAGSVLRMSGMNSGLDTESIVKAMTANTQLKITTQKRSLLKLSAQQDLYRSLIDKMSTFKNKYFDILNRATYFKSASTFNQLKATTTVGGVEKNPIGVNITTTGGANAGTYDVRLDAKAQQATWSGQSLNSGITFDSAGTDPTIFTSGSEYSLDVTVGGTTKQVTFTAGTTKNATREALNTALKTAFGSSNASDLTNNTAGGKVYVDATGAFKSLESAGITTTTATELKASHTFGGSSAAITYGNGQSSLKIMINGEEKTVSFSTVSDGYFSDLFNASATAAQIDKDGYVKGKIATSADIAAEVKTAQDNFAASIGATFDAVSGLYKYDSNGQELSAEHSSDLVQVAADTAANAVDDNGFLKSAQAEHNSKIALFKTTMSGMFTEIQHSAYDDWKENLAGHVDTKKYSEMSQTQKDLFDAEYTRREAEDATKEYDKVLLKKFDEWWEADMKAWNETHTGTDKRTSMDYSLDRFKAGEYDQADGYLEGGDVKYYNSTTTTVDGKTVYTATTVDATKFAAFVGKTLDGPDGDFTKQYEDYVQYRQLDRDAFGTLGAYNEYTAFVNNAYSTNNFGNSNTNEPTLETFQSSQKTLAGASEMEVFFNESAIRNTLQNTTFADGTKLNVNVTGGWSWNTTTSSLADLQFAVTAEDTDGDPVKVGIAEVAGSSTNFGTGLSDVEEQTATLTTSTKLSELGLTANASGKFNVTINGSNFEFKSDATIKDMMTSVNTSSAGVTMEYSSVTNSFSIKTKDYGKDADISIIGDTQGLFSKLGFQQSTAGVATKGTKTEGQNMVLNVNGATFETSSNSYEIDGTTFTFDDQALTGAANSFRTVVAKDNSKVIDSIKQFVEDYNQLIKDVYGIVDEKPVKKSSGSYYFLTDEDKAELELSESQEKDWDTAAKKGILYNDSTLQSVMSNLRTTLYDSIESADGTKFALFSMGITTSSDWLAHGQLQIDEDKLAKAFEEHSDEIVKLFSDPENGIMAKFDKALDGAIATSGARQDKGVLVQKAGKATGTSATDNAIFDKIKSINTLLTSLESRYQQQQDRYWKVFTAMETQLGNINSQSSYITQLTAM